MNPFESFFQQISTCETGNESNAGLENTFEIVFNLSNLSLKALSLGLGGTIYSFNSESLNLSVQTNASETVYRKLCACGRKGSSRHWPRTYIGWCIRRWPRQHLCVKAVWGITYGRCLFHPRMRLLLRQRSDSWSIL